MTAKLTALFFLSCLRRPVDFLAGFSAVSGRFPPFSAHDEKGLPIRPKKNEPHLCGPQQFLPRRGANIYDPCVGPAAD